MPNTYTPPGAAVESGSGMPWALIILAVLVIAAVILYFWYRNKTSIKHNAKRFLESVFLEIQVPKDVSDKDSSREPQKEEKDIIGVAEQLFASLSGTSEHSKGVRGFLHPNEHISFEIVSIDKKISFYVNCPRHLRDMVEKQVHAQYPKAHIEEVKYYNIFKPNCSVAAAEFGLQKKYYYPIRTYKTLETDPLNAVTNSLSKLSAEEAGAVQLVISPAGEAWRGEANRIASSIQQGKSPKEAEQGQLSKVARDIGKSFFKDKKKTEDQYKRNDLSGRDRPVQLTPMQQEIIKRLEEKASRAGFGVNLRMVVSAVDKSSAENHIRNLLSSLMQYSMPPFNGLKVKKISEGQVVTDFIYRVFHHPGKSMILNTEELTSLWHLPTRFTETPNIKWLGAKRAPAPTNISDDGIVLGLNSYRGVESTIKLSPKDRMRHFYIIGRTGTGKSEFIKNLAIQDVKNGEGLAVIDPHGDLAEGILEHVPKSRAEDVIYFNPSDTERPMGLNMLEVKRPEMQDFAVQEMIEIFYKLFPPEMIGPMFEHNMRNVMLTLMADRNNPGTIAEIPRMFTDQEYQREKVSRVTDPVVRNFWEKEMAKTSDFHKSEMLGYLISKVGRFVENEMMRNIIGQTRNAFDFREIMDQGKILIVNLSKGMTGEVNSKLLGLILVSKLQMAALSRADKPESERRPFYLYVDEFQNFVTDSFATILSEARKYQLGLIIAHQYLGQLSAAKPGSSAQDSSVRDAVFGNVGTMACFRIGVEDAETMAKEFEPVFNEFDLVNIERFQAYVKLMINGTTSRPFNMGTLPPAEGGSAEIASAVKQLSRMKFGRAREQVVADIMERSQLANREAGPMATEATR